MEILATIPVYTFSLKSILLSIIIAVIAIGGLTFFLTSFQISNWFIGLVKLIFIIAGTISILYPINNIEKTSTIDYIKYKVVINKTINARDFLDKYEILSRKGEIFTIREIEMDFEEVE